MADFMSNFWSWFIIVPTVVGIIALFWLNRWMTTPGKGPEEGAAKPTGHVWDGDLEELSNPLPRWWLNLFYLTLIFAIVYLVLYPGLGTFAGALGWTSTGQYDTEIKRARDRFDPLYEKYLRLRIEGLARDPEARRTGERLYITYCTGCHGADARGGKGYPNLRDRDWLFGGDPAQIKESIMKGRGRAGSMPTWEAVLGQEGLFNVTEYVLSLSGKRHDENAAVAGRVKFQQLCIACHGKDGRGNPQLGAPNLADNIWLYGGSQKDIMESIAKGRGNEMPAWGEFLGEAKSHLLASYIYGLSRPELREKRRP